MAKRKLILIAFVLSLTVGCFSGCSEGSKGDDTSSHVTVEPQYEQNEEISEISTGETAMQNSIYTDKNGDTAVIPNQFRVSEKEDEQTISTGLVVIGQALPILRHFAIRFPEAIAIPMLPSELRFT